MSQPSIVLKHIKPTQAQIDKFINKKQKKQRKYKPGKKLYMEKKIFRTIQKEERSVQPIEVIRSEVLKLPVEDKGIESNGTIRKEETSVQPNEVIPSEVLKLPVEDKGIESIGIRGSDEPSVEPNELIPCDMIKQEIHNDSNMMENGTQSMDNMPILSNDFDPNIVIKREVEDEDDGYITNYNVEQDNENMFGPSEFIIPSTFDRELQQNDNMENYMPITAQESMFGQSNNFIPNFNCGQEHNVVNMRMVLPHYMYDTNGEILPFVVHHQAIHNNDNEWINKSQANHNMPSTPYDFVPIKIKQEKEENHYYDDVDNIAQDDMYDPSNSLIPDTINGPGIQNNDNVGINISQANHNMPSTPYDFVPIKIKQEKEENHYYDDVDNIAQDDMYDLSNSVISDTINRQGVQNNDNLGINISHQNENIPCSSNGYVPYTPIKQEILED